MLEEPQLNGRIASVINKLTNSAGWQAREELRGALRGPKTKPDVLITRSDGPPIVLETEYAPAATVVDDCMKASGGNLTRLWLAAPGGSAPLSPSAPRTSCISVPPATTPSGCWRTATKLSTPSIKATKENRPAFRNPVTSKATSAT